MTYIAQSSTAETIVVQGIFIPVTLNSQKYPLLKSDDKEFISK
jgi:hypothetical protein